MKKFLFAHAIALSDALQSGFNSLSEQAQNHSSCKAMEEEFCAHSLKNDAPDLAQPLLPSTTTTRLSSSPNIWITHDFLSIDTIEHILSKIPTNESQYMPCIGQFREFEFKKCTFVPIEKDDEILESVLRKIEKGWGMNVEELKDGGLPIIRYVPGARAVKKHGDEDRKGVVPNATLVMYLTESDRAAPQGPTGQTIFPDANVVVTPKQGAVLSFQNVDENGGRHPRAKHLVSAVPTWAKKDRLIIQIPIAHKLGMRPFAYPEHVSGDKENDEEEGEQRQWDDSEEDSREADEDFREELDEELEQEFSKFSI